MAKNTTAKKEVAQKGVYRWPNLPKGSFTSTSAPRDKAGEDGDGEEARGGLHHVEERQMVFDIQTWPENAKNEWKTSDLPPFRSLFQRSSASIQPIKHLALGSSHRLQKAC